MGFGCMSLTQGFYDAEGLSEEGALAVLQAAIDAGVTLFNTSDLYGPYTNERLLGASWERAAGGCTSVCECVEYTRRSRSPLTLLRPPDLLPAAAAPCPAGKALAANPGKGLRVATKWGPMFGPGGLILDASPENCRRCGAGGWRWCQERVPSPPATPTQTRTPPARCCYCAHRRCCEGSLERLGQQCIDLITLRGPLNQSVPLEDTMGALKVC